MKKEVDLPKSDDEEESAEIKELREAAQSGKELQLDHLLSPSVVERLSFKEKVKAWKLVASSGSIHLELCNAISDVLLNKLSEGGAEPSLSDVLFFLASGREISLEEHFSEEGLISKLLNFSKVNYKEFSLREKTRFLQILVQAKEGSLIHRKKEEILLSIISLVTKELEAYPYKAISLALRLIVETKLKIGYVSQTLLNSERIHKVILENCGSDFQTLKNLIVILQTQKSPFPENLRQNLYALLVERFEECLEALEEGEKDKERASLVLKDILQIKITEGYENIISRLEKLLDQLLNSEKTLKSLNNEDLKLLLLILINHFPENKRRIDKLIKHIQNHVKRKDLNSNQLINICFGVLQSVTNKEKHPLVVSYLEYFNKNLIEKDLDVISQREFSYLFYILSKQRGLKEVPEILMKMRERLSKLFEQKQFRLKPLLTALKLYSENESGLTYFYAKLEKNLIDEMAKQTFTFDDIKYIRNHFFHAKAGSRKLQTLLKKLIQDQSLDKFQEYLAEYREGEAKYDNLRTKKREAYRAGLKFNKGDKRKQRGEGETNVQDSENR